MQDTTYNEISLAIKDNATLNAYCYDIIQNLYYIDSYILL